MASDAVPETPATLEYATPAGAADSGNHAPGAIHVHAVSPWLLLGVYGALVFLTIMTVTVTLVDFGNFNVWVALGIAVAKAGLVAFFFMHLKWDSPFNGMILVLSFLFVAFFIGIAVLDSKEYQHNYQPPSQLVEP